MESADQTLTLTVTLVWHKRSAGGRQVYLRSIDDGGLDTSWRLRGALLEPVWFSHDGQSLPAGTRER